MCDELASFPQLRALANEPMSPEAKAFADSPTAENFSRLNAAIGRNNDAALAVVGILARFYGDSVPNIDSRGFERQNRILAAAAAVAREYRADQ